MSGVSLLHKKLRPMKRKRSMRSTSRKGRWLRQQEAIRKTDRERKI